MSQHTLFCDICEINNYPCVSIENYIIDKKLVCRSCLLTTIRAVKKDKLDWYFKVKLILLRKLHNNEPKLVDYILTYLGINSEKDIRKGRICSYCREFMYDFEDDLSIPFYYFICNNCL